MASLEPCSLVSLNHVGVVPNHINANKQDHHKQIQVPHQEEDNNNNNFDYSQRAQWLRAAVLGANDGLVSVASLMMGVGAVKEDVKAMLLAGFAGSVAGACSMAIGEFVSVYTQYEVELSQMNRNINMMSINGGSEGEDDKKDTEMGIIGKGKKLPNPFQAAFASSVSFCVGALVPLLAAAFISGYKLRLMVLVAVASVALMVFGGLGAVLGKTPVVRSCFRVLTGGWLAMAITFGLTKLLSSGRLQL